MMGDFSKAIFNMGIALAREQADQDRRERQGPQDPTTEFKCQRCGKPSVGTGWHPFCSYWCKNNVSRFD